MQERAISLLATIILSVSGFATPEIRNVMARQRFPWNGKVDITYEVVGDVVAGAPTDGVPLLLLTAKNRVTGVNYEAFETALYGDIGTGEGLHHVVWDLDAQGAEFKSDDVVFTVSYGIARYCVIDLSAGASASSYPVTYMSAVPKGGFNTDEYKTTKLVLRLIDPGSFKMGGLYDVTLNQPFYCGIFEVTQKQYSLVMGSNPSSFSGDKLPVEKVSYNLIRGSSDGRMWPSSSAVDSSSFMGTLSARTGLDFDLPTEAQWEYACRAGTTTTYSYGSSADGDYMWYSSNSSTRTHDVGTKEPNPWGLYDMHGNVWEWCLDWYNSSLISGVENPKGFSYGTNRVRRGGSWGNSEYDCTSSNREGYSQPNTVHNRIGFRLVRTLPNTGDNLVTESELGLECADVLCVGDSVSVAIDLNDKPVYDSPVVRWDASWIGSDCGAMVIITDNGMEVKRTTGSGELILHGIGRHELRYTTYIDGVAQDEVYEAVLYNGWKYVINDDGLIITETTRKLGLLTIPSKIDGCCVKAIGENVFSNCSGVTSVTIPDCITSVGNGAFRWCRSLVSIDTANELMSIGDYAFDGCDSLPSREDGYKIVGGWLVGYSNDAAGTILDVDELRGIVGGALEGCTALRTLEFSDKAVIGSIGTAALNGCTELQSLVLPPSLKSIGDEAFMGCSYLGDVIVPGSVKSVGARAFKNCTGFTSAQIEYGVEALGEEAFCGDWQISEVDIPSTVTNIGKNAFGGDSSIIRVGLCGDIRTVADIFSNYKLIREATVKEGTGAIVDGLFANCTQLADVRFFGNCPALVNDGANLYKGAKSSLKTYVSQDSTGWDGTPGSHQLPQAWPLTGSYRKSIAYWDVPTYLVEFDSNGGTLGVQSTYQYSERKFSLPPEPVQTGYSFAGWWTKPSGGLQVTADTVFIEGVYRRLYAHWVKGHWVFLNPAGGTVTNDFVTYVEQTVYGVLPAAVRTGYAFGGWQYNGQTVLPTTPISTAADHTLVAQWEAYKYSVKFNANGGEGEMQDAEMTYDVEKPLGANAFRRVGLRLCRMVFR